MMKRTPEFRVLAPAFALFFATSSALACPASIRLLRTAHLAGETICSIADRYSEVRARLVHEGSSPDRIADAVAPRFIKGDFWEKVRTEKAYDPWTVYDPAPTTWGKWERGREFIDDAARKDFRSGTVPVLSLKWVLGLHGIDMKGLLEDAGHFRGSDVIGAAVERAKSIPTADLAKLRRNRYRTASGEPLVSWTQTGCYEDTDPAYVVGKSKVKFEDQISAAMAAPPKSFTGAAGEERQCGYFTYSPNEEIRPQLVKWVKNLNDRTAAAFRSAKIDPLVTAARAQKWFISIHPFSDGNGRTSRFAMDYLLESIGLPPPILADMDTDLLSTESEWADEIGRGMVRTLKILEKCADMPATPGCRTVATDFSAKS